MTMPGAMLSRAVDLLCGEQRDDRGVADERGRLELVQGGDELVGRPRGGEPLGAVDSELESAGDAIGHVLGAGSVNERHASTWQPWAESAPARGAQRDGADSVPLVWVKHEDARTPRRAARGGHDKPAGKRALAAA